MKMIKIIFLFIIFYSFNIYAFSIPKDGMVEFEIIRKNKVIGSHEIKFINNDDALIVETNISIDVKILFIPAYKFSHKSQETWIDGELVKFDGYTDFEDEREYYVKGYDSDDFFIASGMDGDLKLDKNIISSNFWNIKILKEKKLFDTQKGIVREIQVKDLGSEKIKIKDITFKCKKFSFNASSNPKDKGPFPEYTLWYGENDELLQFKFKNWKDKKIISLIRKF